MDTFKIALLQLNGSGYDQEKNLERGLAACREAKAMGADLALFPEMWNTGYQYLPEADRQLQAELYENAITRDSAFLQAHKDLAQELEMGICVSYLEQYKDRARNSLVLYDSRGNDVLHYSKVHSCDFQALESSCYAGDDFYVCDYQWGDETICLGAMICFDREAPESARILMLKGAEIILTPNACGLSDLQLDQFKTRAFENAAACVMTNYASPSQNGHSIAFDAQGGLIVDGGEQEKVVIAEIDLAAAREYRKSTIWANAFRRPSCYQQLLSADIAQVYQRKNSFGEALPR